MTTEPDPSTATTEGNPDAGRLCHRAPSQPSIMARTPHTAAANHWSGFTGTTQVAKDQRKVAEMLKRLKFSEEAAIAIVTDGLDDSDDMSSLDHDNAKSICASVRNPARGTDGVPVGPLQESRLAVAFFIARTYERRSRIFDITTVTMDSVKAAASDMELIKAWKNPDPDNLKITYNDKNPAKTWAAIDLEIARYLGVRGTELSYVVRTRLIPPDEDDDIPYDSPDKELSDYKSLNEELIARMPIIDESLKEPDLEDSEYEKVGPFHSWFTQDNAVVFLLLYKIFNKTHVWSHCKEFSKKKNGRAVYFAAKEYTLGKEHSSIATAAADRIIREATYHGEERNWTYQHYHTKMVEQFQILEEI